MQKIITAFVIVLGSLQMAMGQVAPGIEWQNTIGGSGSDMLISVQQTTEGGYILAGHSYSNISGDKTENSNGDEDYWIVKADANGNIQWQNTIGGNNHDILSSIQQTTDGGYIVIGRSNSSISGDKTEYSNGGDDYWMVKVDSLGNLQWQNTIGGSSSEFNPVIQQTSDGGYIIGGSSISDISGDKTENNVGDWDYWVVKTDFLGNIQWQNTIGGSNSETFCCVQQTSDGGYILGGSSNSNISGDKTENRIGSIGTVDYWILKTDNMGNILWQNTIGGNVDDALISIEQTIDGGYVLSGWSTSNLSGDKTENNNGGVDCWIVKTDSVGSIQWDNTIGGSANDWESYAHQTIDGGYIIGENSSSNISGDKTENSIGSNDYWIIKTNNTGNILWQNTIGGSSNDAITSIQQTTGAGYIAGGFSNSNISGDKTENCLGGYDYWIVKLYPDTITSINNIEQTTNKVQVIPNPFTNEITISLNYPNTSITLSLFDIMGKEILSQRITTSNHKLQTSSLAKGIYFLKLNVDGNVITKKVVKM